VLLLEVVRQAGQLDGGAASPRLALGDGREPLPGALGELEAGELVEALAHRGVVTTAECCDAAASSAFSIICTGTPVSTNLSAQRVQVMADLCW